MKSKDGKGRVERGQLGNAVYRTLGSGGSHITDCR